MPSNPDSKWYAASNGQPPVNMPNNQGGESVGTAELAQAIRELSARIEAMEKRGGGTDASLKQEGDALYGALYGNQVFSDGGPAARQQAEFDLQQRASDSGVELGRSKRLREERAQEPVVHMDGPPQDFPGNAPDDAPKWVTELFRKIDELPVKIGDAVVEAIQRANGD